MPDIEKQLQRWVEAQLIDAPAASRILEYERESGKGRLRWPAILCVGFGALMLCAGILLFVAAHWDNISPTQRFSLVLGMVAVFHLAAGLLGEKVHAIGVALHVAGTASLGAGIYLAGQIFNLEEHWPGGIMLWALGAVLAWLVLRQWPQALLAAVLLPWWVGGEWMVATEGYRGGSWTIASQGFLLLAILYLTVKAHEPNRALRMGLVWVGALALIPFILVVIDSGSSYSWYTSSHRLPTGFKLLGYGLAYLPALALAWYTRRKESLGIFVAAFWVLVLSLLSLPEYPEHNPWIYLWLALGACGFCYWGMRENRKLFINYGTAIFALDVIAFYFSSVLDKLGRSMGLILMGIIFLAGGWVLNRLRMDLIARATSAGGEQ
jgi:uncharacterized membrane protein